jgi:hypothetical protein
MILGFSDMVTIRFRHAAAMALAAALSVAAFTAVQADIKDYEFRLVQSDVKQGNGAIVAVQLIDKRSGKTVPDAVIFATRIDMAPDGMPTMDSPIEALPSTEPGIYRFKTNLTMAGGWQFSLAAKIQGENGTLENKLVLKAVQ